MAISTNMANIPPLFTSNADTNDFMELMNSELFRSDAISPPVMISEPSPLPLNILLSDLPINDITSWNPVQPSLQEYVEHIPTPSYGWAELLANTSEYTATPASPLTVSATRCTVKPGRSEVAGMVAMQDPTVLPLLVSFHLDAEPLTHNYFRRLTELYVQHDYENASLTRCV
jgi:hypothetical protein